MNNNGKFKLFTRIMAGLLVFLMILSVAGTFLYYIFA